MKLLRSKKTQLFITLLLCFGILASGSFAWFSVTQNALNEFSWNPEGVNLHDDFLDPNKDVYVENTSRDPVIVRIKLAEFMQYETKLATVVLPEGALREDRATWARHNGGGGNLQATECTGGLHTYWTWLMGGQKWYVPATADQAALEGNEAVVRNHPLTQAEEAALAAQIAADLDKDGLPYTPSTQTLLDAVSAAKADLMALIEGYTADTEEARTALSAARQALNDAQTALNTAAKQRYGVMQTRPAIVLTMAEWAAGDQKLGDFWVVDTNGWCYWANVLEAGEATGLLLNGVEATDAVAALKSAREAYYYGIDISMQAATAEDVAHYWTASPELPNIEDFATANAQTLLNRIAAVCKTGAAPTVKAPGANAVQAQAPAKGKYWKLAGGVWQFNDGRWSYDGETWLLDGQEYPFAEDGWALLDGVTWTYIDDLWYFDGDTWLELATLPAASSTPAPSASPTPTPSITPLPSETPLPSASPAPSAAPTPSETPVASASPQPTEAPPATQTPQPSAVPEKTAEPEETPPASAAPAVPEPPAAPEAGENGPRAPAIP